MARRTIYDHDPDPARLLDELYFRVERGVHGLPLGNVSGHAQRRYTACYGVLCLVEWLVERGLISPASRLEARGARFQDKQTSVEFPAAHVLPCDLAVSQPAQPRPAVHLYDLLQNPFNRTFVRLNIFGRTDRAHRLVNVADRSCEAGTDGMAAVFVEACEEVVQLSLRAGSITRSGTHLRRKAALTQFNTILVPGFANAARVRLRAMEKSRSRLELERMESRRGDLVDRFGRSAAPQPTDTRLSSSSDEARIAATISLCQILRIYTDESLVDPHALARVEGQIGALSFNETVI
jgi:hypothetical protein